MSGLKIKKRYFKNSKIYIDDPASLVNDKL